VLARGLIQIEKRATCPRLKKTLQRGSGPSPGGDGGPGSPNVINQKEKKGDEKKREKKLYLTKKTTLTANAQGVREARSPIISWGAARTWKTNLVLPRGEKIPIEGRDSEDLPTAKTQLAYKVKEREKVAGKRAILDRGGG